MIDPAEPTRHTDIRASGWVAILPAVARPYALLGRFDRPIGAWLLFLPGLWSILLARGPTGRSVWLILLFLVGSFVMRAAGCVVNDLWDRDLDRRVTRTAGRPLASGAVSTMGAVLFMGAMAAVGLAILLSLNPLSWALGVFSLVLVVTYPLAKRVTWWPQLMLGFTFGWGAPMGYAATAGHLGWDMALLYAGAIFWIVGYDTIYAHQDREDDALVGIGSTARLFGTASRPWIAIFFGAALLCIFGAGALAGLRLPYFVPMLGVAGLLLLWQVIRLDINAPASCLRLFKLNREAGLLIGTAILAGRL